MTNSEISDIFSFLAKLMDIHQENSFKAKSYANAAFQIDKLPIQLIDLPKDQIAIQKGIGESTAKKIHELLDTGELEQLKELILKTPEGILELMKIKGIGPKKIMTIWHELGIESPGELLYACNENRLIHYKGFGEKSQESIRESLEFYFNNQQRFLFAEIEQLGLQIHQILLDNLSTKQIYLTGDLARQNEIVDTLEFVVCLEADQVKSATNKMSTFHFVSQITQDDVDIISYTFQERIPINIHCCKPATLSTVLFKTNSSPEFIEEFNLQFGHEFIINNQPEFEDEAAIFEKAHLPFIPPFAREKGILTNKSALERLPHTIQASEIKGVIHSHSTWSDGKNTIAEMAQDCIHKGYEYLVMSDHSVSSFYANGLSIERIQQQHAEIDKLNQQLTPFKIFKSIECDILSDGHLDYPNEILQSFDIVITSIHQNLKMTEEKAMSRLLQAIKNPYTRILGHPTGRLLLSRKAYPIDHKTIIDACKEYQVAIEINANPRRLDIDWRWIQYAIEQGVLLSINPDAHSLKGIDDIRYGVLVAQKALLTSTHNVSSFSLAQFEHFLTLKKV